MNKHRCWRRAVLVWAAVVLGLVVVLPAAWGQAGPVITRQPASQTNLAGANVTLSVGVSGTGPFGYQWQLNGTNLPDDIIVTVAGDGAAGYSGDGRAAINASLDLPRGVAVDASGNLFIADTGEFVIRKVDTNGVITTVAGIGVANFTGDGGPATNANLGPTYGVVADASGNFFIADQLSNRIRKVDANGIITTLAGHGASGYSGDYGTATNASLAAPSGVAVDASGNLFIADYGNARVRRVLLNEFPSLTLDNLSAANEGAYRIIVSNSSGSVTSAVASVTVLRPPAIVSQPAGVVAAAGSSAALSVDATGTPPFSYAWYFNGTNLLATGTNSVLSLPRVSLADGGGYTVVVTNLLGSVTSAVATLTVGYAPSITNEPASQAIVEGAGAGLGVGVTGTGPFNYQWQFNGTNLPTDLIITAAGGGTNSPGDGGRATNASLNYPAGVGVDGSGNLFICVASKGDSRVCKVDAGGIITTAAGIWNTTGYSGDGGPATNASLNNPNNVAVDASGNLFIADSGNHVIRKVDTNGVITTVAGNGSLSNGGEDGGPATNVVLNNPSGVAVDASGELFIVDENLCRIRRVDTDGIITTVAGKGFFAFAGDGGPATNASLSLPSAIALDVSGNVFIADGGNFRIRRVDTNGVISTVAGNGFMGYSGDGGPATNASLNNPDGVAVDAIGNLFISDSRNNSIRKVDANGFITTVAGGAVAGFSGDGGPATKAALAAPLGVAAALSGSLYIADSGNDRARRIALSDFPKLTIDNVSGATVGGYQVIVTGPFGSVTSAVASVTALLPPSIVSQPASLGVTVGGTATLSVEAAGTAPLSYAWYFGGTNLVAGGTNAVLTLGNLSLAEGGGYSVVVTNLYGSVTSAVATLTVGVPPTIASQPVGQTNLAGTTATLSVGVSGTGPFTYQWQFNGTNLPNTIVSDVISTVAGGGTNYPGDGGAATNASLNHPFGVAFDRSGNLFIADGYNNRIRKVDLNGIITTVAGNGLLGYSGDGGAATNASLSEPYGVAVDASGNLFIADAGNQRIRKVDANGIITTVAGNPVSVAIVIGVESNWVGDYSGDGGTATKALLNSPEGVAVDPSGNLLIADLRNNRIRKVDAQGVINTVAGNGLAGYLGDGGAATNASLWYPSCAAVDATGNLYMADDNNGRIRKVDTNGIIASVAGNGSLRSSGDGGAATNASLAHPTGVAVDGSGNLFIADRDANLIRAVDASGKISTVAGGGNNYPGDGGMASKALLAAPFGVALDPSGNLFIADSLNARIRKVALGGIPVLALTDVSASMAGTYQAIISSPYGSVTSAVAMLTVLTPPAIVTQPSGLAVAVGETARFTVVASGTEPLSYAWYFNSTNAVQAGTNATLSFTDAALGAGGSYTVVVANPYGSATGRVATLSVGYPPIVTEQPASRTNLPGSDAIVSVEVAGTGPLSYQWQMDGTNLPNDIISTVAGGGTNFPGDGGAATNASLGPLFDVAADAFGNLFLAEQGNNRIRKVDASGTITTVAGGGTNFPGDGGAAANVSLETPYGVAVDAAGNIFMADYGTNRVRKVDVNGILTTVAGNGSPGYSGDGGAAANATLWNPRGLAVDAFGNLFIADQGNNRIRKVDTNGFITTVAGNGSIGYSGDGGAATNTTLFSPAGVTVDAAGNLYINDLANLRVRKVDAKGVITTVAGGGANNPGGGGAATNAALGSNFGAAADAVGNLFISDATRDLIYRVDSNGDITTVAGNGSYGFSGDGGAATNASLKFPTGLAVDATGDLLIADFSNNRIRKLAASDTPAFSIDGISAANSGNYQVIVTSPYGSVTSAVATLTVTAPGNENPVITMNEPVIAGGNLILGFGVAQGTNSAFTLLEAASVTGPWVTNGAAVLTTNGAGGGYTFTVGAPGRVEFYRVRAP